MNPFHTVRRPLTGEVMPLHHPRMTTATRRSNHIHKLPLRQISRRQHLTNLQPMPPVFTAKLASELTRLTAGFREQLLTGRLSHLLATTTNLSHLTTLRTTGQPARLITETKLNRIVTVAILSPNLRHHARPRLNHRYGKNHPVLGVDLRHPNFSTKQPDRHSMHLHDKQKV